MFHQHCSMFVSRYGRIIMICWGKKRFQYPSHLHLETAVNILILCSIIQMSEIYVQTYNIQIRLAGRIIYLTESLVEVFENVFCMKLHCMIK